MKIPLIVYLKLVKFGLYLIGKYEDKNPYPSSVQKNIGIALEMLLQQVLFLFLLGVMRTNKV
jgi:hypothetical protein